MALADCKRRAAHRPERGLRTDASGRAALRLLPDTSLRIAGATELLLQPGNRVELLEGRIYLDTRARTAVRSRS